MQQLEENNIRHRDGIKTHGQNYTSREAAIAHFKDNYRAKLQKNAEKWVK